LRHLAMLEAQPPDLIGNGAANGVHVRLPAGTG
jgi:hypothetical protein